MNWKQINEQYPQAFLEWVNSRYYENQTIETIVKIQYDWIGFRNSKGESDLIETDFNTILQLPEYFDALGIHVDTVYDSPEYQVFVNELILMNNGEWADEDSLYREDFTGFKHFPNRREALEAGVIKAFEIREEQLKQKEK